MAEGGSPARCGECRHGAKAGDAADQQAEDVDRHGGSFEVGDNGALDENLMRVSMRRWDGSPRRIARQTVDTRTCTSIDRKSSAVPRYPPVTGMICALHLPMATGIRCPAPTRRCVGSKAIQPASGRKTLAHCVCRPAAVVMHRGIGQITRDRLGSEAETAHDCDEERSDVPARSASKRQRLGRALRALLVADTVGDRVEHPPD